MGQDVPVGASWTPQSLADVLPDGVVLADADGRVELVSATAARMLAIDGDAALGRPLGDVLALTDTEGRDWCRENQPYDGLRIRTGVPEQSWLLPGRHRGAHERAHHPRRPRRSGRPGRGGAARRTWSRATRPRALRPRRHRRPRAALAADRRQGLRAGDAQPLGPAHRRAEEADAHHRPRRLRPAQPADRRAARRRPHRHRPALAPPTAQRRGGAGGARRRLGRGRHRPSARVRRGAGPAADRGRSRQVHPGRHQPGRERGPARLRGGPHPPARRWPRTSSTPAYGSSSRTRASASPWT